MDINANGKDFKQLNQIVRDSDEKEINIINCMGQRYIGASLSDKNITINGTPGNAVGSYLNGATLTINGNAQDATGDTMNDGEIVINGSSGDATALAMRGGEIYVRDNVGYRAGIHMKSYKEKNPTLVVGGSAGSFLGEYLAGGNIIILGLYSDNYPVSDFCGTGMHGGKIYIRSDIPPRDLPKQVVCDKLEIDDLGDIEKYIDKYCELFNKSKEDVLSKSFYLLTANSKNPYKQLYVHN